MSTFFRATLVALLATTALAVPGLAQAASGPDVTVQVEGRDATIVEQRDVLLDYNKFNAPEPWPGSTAPANSIAAALETALNDAYGTPPAGGWWDRQPFVSEIKGEAMTWPSGTWSLWTNDIYGNKGVMDGGDQWGLDYGDEVLISAGGSIGDFPDCPCRPERLPVDLSGTGIDGAAAVPVNTPFPVKVTAWMPQEGDTDMPPGPSHRQRATHPIAGEDFTVVAMPADTLYDTATVGGTERGTAESDTGGNATIAIDTPGEALLKAVREDPAAPFGGSPLGAQGRSEAHRVCVYELNSGACHTPVFTPASSLDAGTVEVDGIGAPVSLKVEAPNGPNTVAGVRVFGPDAADFLVSAGNCVDERVAEGSSCPITVRLAPTAEGTRNATLRVQSDSESLPRDIALTGTGTKTSAPEPSTSTPALTLHVNPANRKVRRGKGASLKVTVQNTGDGQADDVTVCLRPPNGFSANRVCGKRPRLAAGAAATLRFTLRAGRRATTGRRTVRTRTTARGLGLTRLDSRLRIIR